MTAVAPRYRAGDEVTVQPVASDPILLTMQRYARVSRVTEGGCYVRLGAVWPPDEEFGPIPARRLLPGWRDEHGRLRAP